MSNKNLILLPLIFLFLNCSRFSQNTELPILGPFERIDNEKQYYPIPDFVLINQDGDTINKATFKNSLRIVDFFFISCPSICPKVQAQMLKIYNEFPENEQVHLISHSIDTKRDTIQRLVKYAHNLGVKQANRWHFVTGVKEDIFELADDYFNIVVEDSNAAGGFDHSGRIVLVDKEGYIRAFANGTKPDEVDRLIKSIDQLLKSYDNK